MPVKITTTKEQRIERLVKELNEAGLMITSLDVSVDSYYSDSIVGGRDRHAMMGRRRVTASIEVISNDAEETYELLQLWARLTPHYKIAAGPR